MAAGLLDLYIEQGATWRLRRRLIYRDTQLPFDLTGYIGRCHVRRSVRDDSPLIVFTTELGNMVLGDADGTIDLYLSPTQTAALDAGRAVYDLELESPGGDVRRLLQGKVTISPEVTR